MTTFIALYHGKTIGEARLIGLSADQEIVVGVAAQLLGNSPEDNDLDAVGAAIGNGQRTVLRLVAESTAKLSQSAEDKSGASNPKGRHR